MAKAKIKTEEMAVATNCIGGGNIATFDPKLGDGKIKRRKRLRDIIPQGRNRD